MTSGIETVGRSGSVAIERRDASAVIRLMRPDARVNPHVDGRHAESDRGGAPL
jgi:hypothetical protein